MHLSTALTLILLSSQSVTYASPAPADCIACFELKGAEVKMKDGRQFVGYIVWQGQRFTLPQDQLKFPDILLDPKAREKHLFAKHEALSLTIYTRVFAISKYSLDFLYLVSTESNTIRIKAADIASIQAHPKMRYDGYTGAGELPPHSGQEIRLLTSGRPKAKIADNKILDGFVISYNSRIGRKELARIRDEIYAERLEDKREGMKQRYKRKGIVFLSIYQQN